MTIVSLDRLVPGTVIPFGGDRAALVSAELAARFRPGDHLLVVQDSGDLLLIPAAQKALAAAAVGRAIEAFQAMGGIADRAISRFFDCFAERLADAESWAAIAAANAADVERARGGRAVDYAPRCRRDHAPRHDRRLARLARRRHGARPGCCARRACRLERRAGGGAARRGRLRLRRAAECLRRCGRCAAQWQRSGVPHRQRRTGHGPRHYPACARTGSGRGGLAGWRGDVARQCRTRLRLGAVRRSPPRLGRRARLRPGRGAARRRGAAERHSGQPARHRRRLDGGRRRGRHRALRRRGAQLARPQGVQHAQCLLHPAQPGGRARAGLPRGAQGGRGRARPELQAAHRGRRRDPCAGGLAQRHDTHPPRRGRSGRASVRNPAGGGTRPRMGVGGHARGQSEDRRRSRPGDPAVQTATARNSSRR